MEWINNHFEKHVHKKHKPIIVENDKNITRLNTEESKTFFKNHKIDSKINSTSGHTDDSITFIVNDKAFIGDLPKYNMNGSYKTAIIKDNWNKILENRIEEIYLGHGKKYKIE